MKSIIDRGKLSLRSTIANIASVGGLLALLASVLLPLFYPSLATPALILMLAGLLIAMVGIYFANRWVRKPRPEDILDQALKSLSDSHRLYHYQHSAADHLLLTPNALWVLETVSLEGYFTFLSGRWRERMGFSRALRFIVEEHLGDPVKAALDSQRFFRNRISQTIPGGESVPVKALVVFTHPRAELELEHTAIPVIRVTKLRRTVSEKGARIAPELYQEVQNLLDQS